MSLNKSATRRFSLLAGSSLVAASLAGAAFTLSPTFALAANECAPVGVAPGDNGATADIFACTGATTYQATGITYSSNGNLTVNSTGEMDVGAPGVNLTGANADNVTFTATGTLTGTSGAVVDITSAAGDISVSTYGVVAKAAGVTNGVRMESTGGGDITFVKNQPQNSASSTNGIDAMADEGQAAIVATTNGGDIDLTIISSEYDVFSFFENAGGWVRGRERGILAETSGAGGVALDITGRLGVYASDVDGVAAVDIVAGTGGVDINLSGGPVGGRITTQQDGNSPNPFNDALAIRVVSAAAVSVDNTNGLVIGAVEFSGVTGGGVTFDNFGDGEHFGTGPGLVLMYFQGGRWMAAGDSVFSAQDDVVRLAGFHAHTMESGTTIDFGGGADTMTMSGVLVIQNSLVSNLETFNNSGEIYFGGSVDRYTAEVIGLNQTPENVLSMPGATFTGSGDSRLYMNVFLGGSGQPSCETPTGVADCLDLRGGSTAGSTVITITDSSPSAMLSGYQPQGITLVDVSGSGSSAAGHFTLDPASTSYVSPLYGAAFDRPGAFVYLFRYDAETQRHVLVSQPKNRDIFDYAILPTAAQSIWQMTARTVTNRQTDLRDGAEGGSVWLRTAGEVTRRDMATSFEGFDGPLSFDNSYKLHAGTIIGGLDLISGSRGELDYVFGAQIGYVSSSLDMDASQASGKFTGATGGVYASLWSDSFFVDGAFNVNGLTLDHRSPSLAARTTTYVNAIGAQVEAGMRLPIGANTFAEPLVAASWVRTSFEEISLIPGEVELLDAESLRGGLGVRLGATLPGETVSATYFLTGRAWNEFEGTSGAMFHNPGVDMPFDDEFSGTFGEAELGVNVFNAANTLSGFLTSGVQFMDGYSAVNLSLGVRMAW